MSLWVVIEDLVASGVAVTGLGEELVAVHAAADRRVDDALPGWQGRSADGLASLAARWTSEGRAVVLRLVEHAEALGECARQLWAQDRDGAGELRRAAR